MLAAVNVLETPDTVPCGMPSGDLISTQVHRDACVRPGIGNGILTVAAVQGVRAVVAFDDVVAVITGQGVRVRAADNVLETPDTVPCCMPSGDLISTQVHRDACV